MVTIIQSDAEVPAGSYGAFLEASSLPYRLVRLHAGDPLPQARELSHLIILGGAMGVHDGERFPFLLDLQRLMTEVVSQQIPLLGICLGGQLLAHILGGRVTANRYGEKGSQEVELTPAGVADPLFAGIPQTFTTFQWHNDSFEPPPGALLLASSRACPHQAFRFGSSAYGTQFHPEVERQIVTAWAKSDQSTAPVAEELHQRFMAHEERYLALSRRLLTNFLSL